MALDQHLAGRSLPDLYLDTLARSLTGSLRPQQFRVFEPGRPWPRRVWRPVRRLLNAKGLDVVRAVPVKDEDVTEGRVMPMAGETMVGLKRLENLRHCVARVVEDNVPGDLLEAGTWRGGAAIFMRAALQAYGDGQRAVWVADSFQGVPRPDAARYPADAGDTYWTWSELAVPLEEVKRNFARYGLLDDRVRFLPGWFKDTLSAAPIDRLAVLRVDGDLYESTMDTLRPLYDKVSPGGFVIIDDYGCVPGCRQAVEEFRAHHRIIEPLTQIDWTGVFWRKAAA